MKVDIVKHFVSMRHASLLFAFLALFFTQLASAQSGCGNILSVTAPSSVTTGSNEVVWNVPQDKQSSYFVFDVEIWSSSSGGGQPAVDTKIATIGQTRTGQNGNGNNGVYRLTGNVPSIQVAPQTSYFIAVYGREYINGPAHTSLHPWDQIYYGIKSVSVN
ncbi:hypothetical protein THASP1DRAFT_25372 [Thamnocephalis sphaerospora]|uniref:Ser-Thr-rich glycosyl-phosphatidyl-inositol-anchored membrane family-domain-containing protein n=1 Tax=Thamnocephalis sphaerospora TaxID=78915 RepID=A0A4P9XLP2_9FUNG|nr:hypothetical protein THASP1DRAFT_25372 [Thamnocephalis sphaerospora]|eukprot:RKP06271.1 hypothetical protein THASP1DRAFT_25372 [Thamnocephalis sphaerospora]